MEECIAKFVDHQIRKKRIERSESAVYQYGYRLLIEKVCAVIMTFVIAILFDAWMEIFVFCLAFIPLRTFAGGYHAKHSLNCMALSAGVLVLNIFAGKWLLVVGFGSYALLLELALCPVIAWLVPVESSNRKISQSERRYFKRVVLVIYAIQILTELVCVFFGRIDLAVHIVLVHVCVMGSLVAGWKIQSIDIINTEGKYGKKRV